MSDNASMKMQPRIAIVHDDLARSGGAERTVSYMCEVFPDAPVYTSAYLPDKTYPEFRSRMVHMLPGGRFVKNEKQLKQLLPLWLAGFRLLDLSAYDVILSSATYGAKHIRPPKNGCHICYCHAPFRLLWSPASYSSESLPFSKNIMRHTGVIMSLLRKLDQDAMQKADKVATNCLNTAKQIEHIYGRTSEIINPPIRISRFEIGMGDGGYYLCVGRLISHKRVDLAIEACNQLRKHLIVVGDGPEKPKLVQLAGSTVRFAGLVNDDRLKELYANCTALLFPSHEDYGIVPLEAQASGRPVIAYGRGGVLETVTKEVSGVFFSDQTIESVVDAIQRFESMKFDPWAIRDGVKRFDISVFSERLRNIILNPST